MGLIVTAVVLICMFAAVAWQVDDWRRDFKTNFAATSDDVADERLRPVRTDHSRAQAVVLLKECAADLPRWNLQEEQSSADKTKLHYVRTTPLFRFKDDIRVTVAEDTAGLTIHAESKSRVGRGDLGQNPRNVKELLGRLRKRLAAVPADQNARPQAPANF